MKKTFRATINNLGVHHLMDSPIWIETFHDWLAIFPTKTRGLPRQYAPLGIVRHMFAGQNTQPSQTWVDPNSTKAFYGAKITHYNSKIIKAQHALQLFVISPVLTQVIVSRHLSSSIDVCIWHTRV